MISLQAIIGNKADLPASARQVPAADGAALAREFGVPFVETSAATGAGVDDAFTRVAREVVARAEAAPAGAWPPAGGGAGVRLAGSGGSGRTRPACCG
jgi:Ras-related protein Rab-8A